MAASNDRAPYGISRREHASDEVMRERMSLDAEQAQQLLAHEDEDEDEGGHSKDEREAERREQRRGYKIEWQLRTGWAVAGALLTTLLVFLAMLLFTKCFIVEDVAEEFNTEVALSSDFRRPEGDYILDARWDFAAPATTREYSWTILDRIANPDGVFRPMITINGQFPGPLIECNEGDTLVIDVDNQSSNATSVHFHGLFQNGTNWMDGTTGITQCPIAPGKRFRYKFRVEGQSGTYYYHGHQAVQVADGLFGPLVIHSRREKKEMQYLQYSSDRIIMVQDYYHDVSSALLKQVLAPGSEDAPIPNGALINGRNTRDCGSISDKLCNNATATLSSFDLAPDTNHRLRFLNVGAFAWFEISLDEHHLAVTEVDGTDVVPVDTTQLRVGPAQRYSAIISTTARSTGAFWLRARMIRHCFANPDLPGPGLDEVKAVVRYTSPKAPRKRRTLAARSMPASQVWDNEYSVHCKDMDHSKFVPVHAVAAPTPDQSYVIRDNLEIGAYRLQRGFFNSSTFHPNLKAPSLHRTVSNLLSSAEQFTTKANGVNSLFYHTPTELVVQHTGIQVVDLIIQNMDENTHPMHLHGHKFFVLAQGHGYFPGYEALDDEASLRHSNPLRRDTAAVEGFGWLLIRFVADNPGLWAFHCHVAWHSEAGMVMQFLSRPEVMKEWVLPEENLKLCEAEGLERGAAPKDEVWMDMDDEEKVKKAAVG